MHFITFINKFQNLSSIMAGSNHAILDLGEDDLQFTTNDYKVQTKTMTKEISKTIIEIESDIEYNLVRRRWRRTARRRRRRRRNDTISHPHNR